MLLIASNRKSKVKITQTITFTISHKGSLELEQLLSDVLKKPRSSGLPFVCSQQIAQSPGLAALRAPTWLPQFHGHIGMMMFRGRKYVIPLLCPLFKS